MKLWRRWALTEFTAQEKKWIQSLIRRRDHLAYRVANSTRDLTFDKQEMNALVWILKKIGAPEIAYSYPVDGPKHAPSK